MSTFLFHKAMLIILILALTIPLCACGPKHDVNPYSSEDIANNTITDEPKNDTASENALLATAAPRPSSQTPGTESDTAVINSGEPTPAAVAFAAYKAALLSQAEFIDAYDNKKLTLDHLNQMFNPEVVVTVTHFAVIDVDHDGTPEVVLSVDVNGHSDGAEILSYQDGDVYGYSFSDRQFGGLRTDGTFEVSESASTGGICAITFDKNSYSIDKNIYHRLDTDTAGNDIMIYSINEQSVTEDEYDAAYSTRDLLPRVTRYEFTEANVEFVLSLI